MLVMFKGTVWLLSRKSLYEALVPTAILAKLCEVTKGVAALSPFPARFSTCGLSVALSVIVIVPERRPVVVGLKVIVNLQDVPAEIGELHVLVCKKSPMTAMLVMFKGTFWLLVNDAVSLADCVPITVFGMKMLEGAKATGSGVLFLGLRRMKRATEGTPAEFIKNIM